MGLIGEDGIAVPGKAYQNVDSDDDSYDDEAESDEEGKAKERIKMKFRVNTSYAKSELSLIHI